jgi:hypothetical protein
MSVFMLPSAAGTCQVCATKHEATQPHNAQSLPYQMWFQSTYGRGATWADAVAHCPAEVSAAWKEQLLKIGKWSEPKSGSPIATVDESGGVPTPKPLPNMEPTVVDMRANRRPNKRKRSLQPTTAAASQL